MSLDCSTCMACCICEGGLPVEQAELAETPLSKDLIEEAVRVSESLPLDRIHHCVWLVVSHAGISNDPCGKCLHYEQRPKCCRDFTKGGDKCLAAREWKDLASVGTS